jgi:glucose/arabinose dehydrogenase
MSGSQIINEEILFSDLGRIRDIATLPDGSLVLVTDGPKGKLIRVTNK